jgi:hypothetical protein
VVRVGWELATRPSPMPHQAGLSGFLPAARDLALSLRVPLAQQVGEPRDVNGNPPRPLAGWVITPSRPRQPAMYIGYALNLDHSWPRPAWGLFFCTMRRAVKVAKRLGSELQDFTGSPRPVSDSGGANTAFLSTNGVGRIWCAAIIHWLGMVAVLGRSDVAGTTWAM